MKLSGNTILITGGGSGIGLGLAEEFSKLDNQVIIAGRSKEKLKFAEEKGFATLFVDVSDPASITKMAKEAIQAYPSLNAVVQNAGIMKSEDLLAGADPKTKADTVAINLLGPMYLTDSLLPHFKKQRSSFIMTVTSGLAFMPLAMTPTYSATKAALHSYTESLRYQLRNTSIQVIELAPPYVQTELLGPHQASDPHAMPLREFIGEVMQILKSDPDVKEILVKRVQPLRFSSSNGQEKYEAFFMQLNNQFAGASKG